MSRRSVLPFLLLLAVPLGLVGCGNEPPQAAISSPQDGQHFVPGEQVVFTGTAQDEEDGTLEGDALVWTSDHDGQIGTGTSFQRGSLSDATHVITLTAKDGDDKTGTAQITIVVNGLPTVSITSPTTGALFATDAAITFQGTALDGPGNPLSGASLVWFSDQDGVFGTGNSVTTDALSANAHIITLTATDSAGDSESVSISLFVSDAPRPAIQLPLTGDRFDRRETIVFNGTARDAQDGVLPAASLTWSSDLDGVMGTGSPLSTSALSQGSHVITLEAADLGGNIGRTTIALFVDPLSPPVVTILEPNSGTFHTSADTVTFSGQAVDEQDGALTGAALVWRSDRQGVIGEGTLVRTADLEAGTHAITLKATDHDAEYTLATVYVTIDAPDLAGFVRIPGGSFFMGSPTHEGGHRSEENRHQVTLTRGFYLGATEVTERAWSQIMGGPASDLPVVNVTWERVVEFCNLLSVHDGLTPVYTDDDPSAVFHWVWNRDANGYRLPTEAEWEYACRAGSPTAFANGDIMNVACADTNLAKIGWYCGNSGGLHPVGTASVANAWGLRDMHGNVWEWCWDFRAAYPTTAETDPLGPPTGVYRVRRGGSYESHAEYCRSANRSASAPYEADSNRGFRLARNVP